MAFSFQRGADEAAIGLAPASAAGSAQSTDRPPTTVVGSVIVSASSVSAAASLVAGLPIIVCRGCRFVASISVKQQYFNRVL